MAIITGTRTVEIGAPMTSCFQIAADLERATAWHPVLEDVDVHERDSKGRPVVATLRSDAKVRTISGRWRIEYDEYTAIRWRQEKGDVKALSGSWTFEEDGDITRATYAMEVDPGRMLGLLLRGQSVVDKVRDHLLNGAVAGLKQRAESS